MKIYLLTIATLLSFSLAIHAQKPTATFDHIAIYVRNLDTSTQFYSTIFHFDTLPNPFPGFRVRWYAVGDHLAFHVIEGLKDTVSQTLMIHNCFSVRSIGESTQLLDKLAIPYYNGPQMQRGVFLRKDGVHQIFIQDPDKYWIEINDAKH